MRAIPGYPDTFRITENGVVYRGGKPLKPYVTKKGYVRVSVYINGKETKPYIHVLVARAFIGQRPKGFHVDHINFDTGDNRASNLRYLTALENTVRRQLGKRKSRAMPTVCRNGHPYTSDNITVHDSGGYRCMSCLREAKRRYDAKRRARVTVEVIG